MDLKYFRGRYQEEKRWDKEKKQDHTFFWWFFHPIRIWWTLMWENTLGPFWRIKWWIVDGLFRSRMKRKLTIDTLDRTWCDKTEVILHASFQLLVDFIEKEHAEEIVDFWSDFEGNWSYHNLRELYFWWTKIRPNRIDPFDSKWFEGVKEIPWQEMWTKNPDNKSLFEFTPKTEKYKEYWDLLNLAQEIEDRYAQEDQDKLEELIKHRRALWC